MTGGTPLSGALLPPAGVGVSVADAGLVEAVLAAVGPAEVVEAAKVWQARHISFVRPV